MCCRFWFHAGAPWGRQEIRPLRTPVRVQIVDSDAFGFRGKYTLVAFSECSTCGVQIHALICWLVTMLRVTLICENSARADLVRGTFSGSTPRFVLRSFSDSD